MNIIGVSCTIHESSACLVRDGELVFATAEERLSRKKKDASFPVRSIRAALDFAGLTPRDVDHVAIAWSKPRVWVGHNLKLLLNGTIPITGNSILKFMTKSSKAIY